MTTVRVLQSAMRADESSGAAVRSRILAIDAIRAYAIILMVVIHITGSLVNTHSRLFDHSWWIGDVCDAFSHSCVPLFVMISGALLLDRHNSDMIGQFLRRRLSRVFLPALAWLVIYLVYEYRKRLFSAAIFSILKIVIKGPGAVAYHYWYLYMLFGLYLVVPILAVYVKHATKDNVRYFLTLSFLVTSLLPMLSKLCHIQSGISFVVITGYVGYLVAGHYFKGISCSVKQRALLLLTILVMGIISVVGTFILTHKTGTFNPWFYDFFSPNIVILSLASFLWLKEIDYAALQRCHPLFFRLIAVVSSASYSIFLMHILVIDLLAKLGLTSMTFTPLIGISLTAITIIAICTTITMLCRKVPLLQYFFP